MEELEFVGCEKDVNINKEDGRTFHILGDLLLLDDETLKKLFYKLCNFGAEIPKDWGKLEKYFFWPSWYLPNNTRVEPDLFLKFQSFALIIEVKRNDNRRLQTKEQWQKEVEAYFYTYKTAPLPVALIAIGGNSDSISKDISSEFIKNWADKVIVYKCSWHDIYNHTEKQLYDLATVQTYDEVAAAQKRLYQRILYHFKRAELYYYRNFGNLPNIDLTESYEKMLKWARAWRKFQV